MNANGSTPVLALKGVSKSFGPVQALSDVDFEIQPHEVVALVGDNGAGKSTLVKTIAGIHPADSGTISFEGKDVTITSPTDAVALGIATVYQDLALCDNLDVVENLFLGREETGSGPARVLHQLDEVGMERQTGELLENLAVTITDVRNEVGTMSGGQRQQVAIARSLLGEPKLVMLDEPTAALGVRQTARCSTSIKRLRDRGYGVLVISHNLADVFQVADRIFVSAARPQGRRVRSRGGQPGPGRGCDHRCFGEWRQAMTVGGVTVDDEDEEVRSPQFGLLRRFIAGDLAELRVVLALALIWVIFYAQEPRFLSSVNLSNLVLQTTAVGLVSIGIVLVLLLGEIDLSVGAVSGLCAAIMAVLNVKHGWSPYLAIAAGVLAGTAIGLFQGSVFTRFAVPSFVVTLAGLLAWPGAQLEVLGETGTVNLNDPKILGLTSTFYSDTVGWIIALVAIGLFAATSLRGRQRRVSHGLSAPPVGLLVLRIGLVAVATLVAVWVMNDDRGVPLAALILVGFCLVFFYITTRTTFGRHIFAVGGNAEAARRAGIHVTRVRVIVFMIASSMAAIGGIMAASRLLAVNQSSGAGDFLLLAIAGPVIAGTSLFGGRGSVWHALLGALVITSISNGMDLLALQSSVKFMVTGAVLLLAVIIDAIARRQRQAAGRV